MTMVLQCNECGKDIDETGSYYMANLMLVNADPTEPTPVPPIERLDWHMECVPDNMKPKKKKNAKS